MPKFKKVKNSSHYQYLFWCPGCQMAHFVKSRGEKPRWGITGTKEDLPTVHPSIRVQIGDDRVCHSFVVNGTIKFLSDSTHELAGETVPLEDFDIASGDGM